LKNIQRLKDHQKPIVALPLNHHTMVESANLESLDPTRRHAIKGNGNYHGNRNMANA
jgi:hypothetical protein